MEKTKPTAQALSATTDQHAAAARTLAAAFQTETTFGWIMPDAQKRRAMLHRAFRIFVAQDAARGAIYATPGMEAATLWRAPGEAADGLLETLRILPAALGAFGSSIFRALKVADAIKAHHPAEPYWYLHMAGCAPEHQGKGMGGAAIRAGLARADAEHRLSWLETADAHNVPLYQALGFTVTVEWDVPGGGPHFWGMRRPPQGL